MLSSLDFDLGFDPFHYVTVLFVLIIIVIIITIITIIIIKAHFYTSYCYFFLDHLTFHSIKKPKTNSCF